MCIVCCQSLRSNLFSGLNIMDQSTFMNESAYIYIYILLNLYNSEYDITTYHICFLIHEDVNTLVLENLKYMLHC